MLLALDTSTAWASLALFDGRVVTTELTWQAERRHGDEIFPMLERLLALGQMSLGRIERLAVALGPGSFTGVRIALATAKGLARGSGAVVVGIGTLDALAYAHAQAAPLVCALLPAGGADWYAAFFEDRDGMVRTSEYLSASLPEVAARVEATTLFVGELDEGAESTLRDLLGGRARFAPAGARLRRAGYLAELGWRELEAGRVVPVGSLEPIYVKGASIRLAISDRSPRQRSGAAGQSPSRAPRQF